ncbi:hypothetical protein GC175_04990 [bacterium]|nr:hypothetical protein [bacterium]
MIHFIEGYKKEGWIEIVVRIDEHTTRNDLGNAHPLASEWRKRLLQFQGPWIGGGIGELYFKLWLMHKRWKRSYQEIADFLNSTLVKHIQSQRVDFAIDILVSMEIKEEQAKQDIESIISQLGSEGTISFEPVDRNKVREKIRTLDKKWGDLWVWENPDD